MIKWINVLVFFVSLIITFINLLGLVIAHNQGQDFSFELSRLVFSGPVFLISLIWLIKRFTKSPEELEKMIVATNGHPAKIQKILSNYFFYFNHLKYTNNTIISTAQFIKQKFGVCNDFAHWLYRVFLKYKYKDEHFVAVFGVKKWMALLSGHDPNQVPIMHDVFVYKYNGRWWCCISNHNLYRMNKKKIEQCLPYWDKKSKVFRCYYKNTFDEVIIDPAQITPEKVIKAILGFLFTVLLWVFIFSSLCDK